MSIQNLINKGVFFSDSNFEKMSIKENLESLADFRSHFNFSYIFFHNIYYCIKDLFSHREDIHSITFEGKSIQKDDDIFMDCLIILRDEHSNIIEYPQFKKEFDNIINCGKEEYISVTTYFYQRQLYNANNRELISFFDFEVDRESAPEIFEHIFKFINPALYEKFSPFESFGEHNCPVYYHLFGNTIQFDLIKCTKEDLQYFQDFLEDIETVCAKCSDAVFAHQIIPFLLSNPGHLINNESIVIVFHEENEINFSDEDDEEETPVCYNAALYGIKKGEEVVYNKENIILEFCLPKEISNVQHIHYILRDYKDNTDKYKYGSNVSEVDKIRKIINRFLNNEQMEKYIAYYVSDIDKNIILEQLDININPDVIKKKRI